MRSTWHEIGKGKIALDGSSRRAGSSKPEKEALVCKGTLRSECPFYPSGQKLGARKSPQKAEQQPNAPGLLFCFSFEAEGRFTPISRY